MKRPLLSIGILALMTVAVFASERFTAISSLRSFGVERGQRELSRVVGMVGFYGQDQPVQWLVLTVDPQAPALLHEYVVRQGRVVAERHFERDPEQDLPYIPLSMGSLKIDSDRAFVIADMTVPSIRHARRTIAAIEEKGGNQIKPQVIVNRMDNRKNVAGLNATDVTAALDGHLVGTIPNNYMLVRDAVDRGVQLSEIDPANNVTASLSAIILKGDEQAETETDGKSSILSIGRKLFRRKAA